MAMLLVCSLFASAFAETVDTGTDTCSEANGHPETGGFYITGVGGYSDEMAHNDADDPSTYGDKGQKADDTLWTKNPVKPYPDGLPKACTPSMWGDCSTFLEQYSFLAPHTCSLMRFSYPADSGSTVWKMKDNATFQACDFTDAEQITEGGTLPSGAKHVDYPFDYDSFEKKYYFASKEGCTEGQKVAIMPFSEYTSTYDMCYSMGLTSSRIQHCDCDHQIRGTTLNEICHTGFVEGCMTQMPDDTSCCPGDDVEGQGMGYKNGGNCIRKNLKDDIMASAKDIYDKCTDAANKAECDGYKKGDCPWESVGGWGSPKIMNTLDDEIDGANTTFDPICEPWYTIAHCADLEQGNALGAGFTGETLDKIKADITADNCGQSLHLAAYKMYSADQAIKYPAFSAPEEEATTAPEEETTGAPDAESFTAVAALGLMLATLA